MTQLGRLLHQRGIGTADSHRPLSVSVCSMYFEVALVELAAVIKKHIRKKKRKRSKQAALFPLRLVGGFFVFSFNLCA